MSDWLYQVRIRVSENLSESLRSGKHTDLAGELDEISRTHGMSLVCTYDAFKGYCDEAEENGVEEYALTIGQNPLSKIQKKRQNILNHLLSIEVLNKYMRKR